MAVRASGLARVVVCQLIALVAAPAVADQASGAEQGKPPSAMAAIPPSSDGHAPPVRTGETPVNRILISDPAVARAVGEALQEAWRQLEEPRCQALLTEFSDRRGRPLATNIPEDAGNLQTHLARIVFIDGSDTKLCARGAVAVTEPGSRVVRVCGDRLVWRTWRQSSRQVVAAFIHEALHTLGLGENPPSSAEITSRVLKRCGVN